MNDRKCSQLGAIRLIVGLGNPTPKYENTRHNAGFWFLDKVAEQFSISFSADQRFHGFVAKTMFELERVFLLKPQTYMNNSGRSVSALSRYYKIDPENILIVHDEIDFECGLARLKKDGGHGGHNGLRDIISQLQSRDFYRLRIGVGHPGYRDQVVNHVLTLPSKQEIQGIHDAIGNAADYVPKLLKGEFQWVMNHLHSS